MALIDIRAKSQITIPKDIVDSLGLSEGDKMDVYVKDGVICLTPVVIYPKQYLNTIRETIDKLAADGISGDTMESLQALLRQFEKSR